ncbi:MAG: LamG-like jellyroll fold domain-containing protein [Sedimentisphaeraceae bacterium JB056]
MVKLNFILTIVVCVCSTMLASDFWVDYNSSEDRALIWIEAESYDAKTAEFVSDVSVENASGQAFYFDQYSPKEQIDQWWAEYSIDSAAISEPAITLSGTWYCFVRVNQPEVDAEEANYLLVKNDSGDGSGAAWYSAAIAGVDDADDILNNDVAGNGGAGDGQWTWLGASSSSAGAEKEFVLDTEGKIVFRINEREAGANSARVDAICWTNDPNYVPNDAAFGQIATTDGLVLELDAADAGDQVLTYWQPSASTENGTGELSDPAPVLKRIDGSEAGSYIWYYEFDGDDVTDIMPESNLKFGADEAYTVETWVRVPAIQSGSAGRGAIIGNAAASDTGWRFGIRDYGGVEYAIEFNIRDNETVETASKSIFSMVDNHYQSYDADQWIQLVGTRTTIEKDDFTGNVGTTFSLWINGQNVRANTVKVLAGVTEVADFALDAPDMIAKVSPSSAYSFEGDIALIRVYNRVLSTAEVEANYNQGIETTIETQCNVVGNDLNGDCVVNMSDFGVFADSWLASGIVDGQ